MHCPACHVPMQVLRRTYHKRHKWVCPRCNKTRRTSARYQRMSRVRVRYEG